MYNSEVKKTIDAMLELNNDFEFIYENGYGEYADVFIIRSVCEPYKKGYECNINVKLDGTIWTVDVNGFNKFEIINNETELKLAIKQQMTYKRAPCAEQILSELDSASKSDDDYY